MAWLYTVLKEILASALITFFGKDSNLLTILLMVDINAEAPISFNKICLSEDILPN
jgi:hypothetical protein